MDNIKIGSFHIIGISVRTTNENGQSAKDIPVLWEKFMSEGILDQIPNKIDNSLYCIYTDYEKDHTKPYTTILGCKVENLSEVPNHMVSKTIKDATYQKFVAEGNLMQGAVYNEWTKIWNSESGRTFTADFEVYDERSLNPENAVVDIFVAVK
ncbi:GyrI-like domain-containing protein [Pedobacter cryoconitis]|uniref:Putative transcriptional regulator YdeE n=1 Tax=Pedobacter cryoconitis TaxID=188932 RepID=A0A327SBQ5_9SPHI|nr:GyrI-like domain-containing protein [Pedobacter cryoconitis]RAJ25364.1 putative transcriptional regulator YdeE [Pedobacter cryoconitis]